MHVPVFLNEILKIFDPKPGETYIDATVNGGGHALAIAGLVGPKGKVVGIDWDNGTIKNLQEKFSDQKTLQFICSNYVNIASIVRTNHLDAISGILFDCGFSSNQLEASQRGFSFLNDGPLDMRYNTHDNHLTAEKIINTYSEKAIADIFWRYGEERFARRIAAGIVSQRGKKRITRTRTLVDIILQSIPRKYARARIHPATRVFQSLRIAVNDELTNIERGVREAIPVLAPSGKIAVITFHSLEDRIVKQIFKEAEQKRVISIITKKPIVPSSEEISVNPRSRSAKLRVAEKIESSVP